VFDNCFRNRLLYVEKNAHVSGFPQNTQHVNLRKVWQSDWGRPLSIEHGTYKTVKARLWPWLEFGLGSQVNSQNPFAFFQLGSEAARPQRRRAQKSVKPVGLVA
jgi:hypothetical protein